MNAVRERAWLREAITTLEREAARSADTHLLRLGFPGFPGIGFYFKDEAAHPSGSLKHRLARSLYLYALCNGRLQEGQDVVDVSSGSTAISEAWFARLLGLRFTAVMPACTAPGKIRDVLALGGHCDLVDDPAHTQARAAGHAGRGACHLDQFGLAERATDWRGNNNIAESILAQLSREPHPEPAWIVCGAGTGGTSATIGRYLRYRGLDTQLCVAEPTGGAFAIGWESGNRDLIIAHATRPTLIEGIGRTRVEPGFLFDVVDEVTEVDDETSVAATWLLEDLFGVRYGGSSGTNLAACLQLASRMRDRGEQGSIVSLLCDRGERYGQTLFDPPWLAARGIDPQARRGELQRCLHTGEWTVPMAQPGARVEQRGPGLTDIRTDAAGAVDPVGRRDGGVAHPTPWPDEDSCNGVPHPDVGSDPRSCRDRTRAPGDRPVGAGRH